MLLAIGTIVVLFWDVRTPADLTTDHVMTMAMLVVTIAAGHYWLPAVQQRRILPAIGLGTLFIAGTFVCVTGSAGRGAEVAQRKAAVAGNINEARKDIADQLAKARADRAALAATMTKECATGEGPKCRGARASVEYADSHIAILEVRRNDMAPEQEANVRLKHAARVFAFFNPGADVRRIEQGLELIWPFALALIMELGTIVFLGFGLGHGRSAIAGSIHLERAGAGVNPIRLSWVSSSNSGNCMVGLRPAHKSGLNFRNCPRARRMTWLLGVRPDQFPDSV